MFDEGESFDLTARLKGDQSKDKNNNEAPGGDDIVHKADIIGSARTDRKNVVAAEKFSMYIIGLKFLIKQTFAVYFKNIWIFLIISFLQVAIFGGAVMFFDSFDSPSTLILVVCAIILVIFDYLFFVITASQAHGTYSDNNVSIMESVALATKTIPKFFLLLMRIFWFSGVWLLVPVVVIFLVLDSFFSVSSVLMSADETVSFLINLLLIFSLFIFITIVFSRLIYTLFALPLLIANPIHSAKEVLKRSIEITKDKWFLTFSWLFIYKLLLTLPLILMFIFSMIIFPQPAEILNIIFYVSLFIVVIIYPPLIIFYQIFAKEMANPSRKLVLNRWLIISTLLIIILPAVYASYHYKLFENIPAFASIDLEIESVIKQFGDNSVSTPKKVPRTIK